MLRGSFTIRAGRRGRDSGRRNTLIIPRTPSTPPWRRGLRGLLKLIGMSVAEIAKLPAGQDRSACGSNRSASRQPDTVAVTNPARLQAETSAEQTKRRYDGRRTASSSQPDYPNDTGAGLSAERPSDLQFATCGASRLADCGEHVSVSPIALLLRGGGSDRRHGADPQTRF